MKLQEELGGCIEVYTEFGFIDLLTDKEIIEIKNGNNWKHGFGQIIVYGEFYPLHKKRLHLFNIQKDLEIEKFCKKYNVNIEYEIEY